MNGPLVGYNITISEMGHSFYTDLGNKGYRDVDGFRQSGWGLVNKGSFTNLQYYPYWLGMEYAPHPSSAWRFNFYYGYQGAVIKDRDRDRDRDRDWDRDRDRDRDRDMPPVPIPGAVWLLGSGLIGILGVRRKFSQ